MFEDSLFNCGVYGILENTTFKEQGDMFPGIVYRKYSTILHEYNHMRNSVNVYKRPLWFQTLILLTEILSNLKAGPLRLKQLTNTLKIRILSETSILYLIRYASIILTVGLRL